MHVKTSQLVRTLALTLALTLTACGDEATTSGDPNSDNNGGTISLDDLFETCEENLECLGGEICHETFCREACGDVDPCTGAFAACNTEAGVCAQCNDDQPCEANRVCVAGLCQFFCTGDDACGTNQACDLETGTCVEAECRDDDQCQGGFQCLNGQCESILPESCTANNVRCEANVAYTCSADGTREDSAACGESAVCVAQLGCTPKVCEANQVGCIDDDTAFICNPYGTERNAVACRPNQVCDTGVCQNQVCTPDTTICENQQLISCDQTGTVRTLRSCADESLCSSSDFGCTCGSGGVCETRVCQPGSASCAATGFLACNEDGTALLPLQACEQPDICVQGVCIDPTCEAGSTSCANDILLTCNAFGDGYDSTDCLDADGFCAQTESGSTCVTQNCVPDTVRCDADGEAVLLCDASGASEMRVECPEDNICDSGACTPLACSPSSPAFCQDGDVYACNEMGTGVEIETSCGNDICVEGECQEATCTPNDTTCMTTEEGEEAWVCNPSGTEYTFAASCPTTCTSGRCDGVTAEICNNIIDDDGNDLADCADPACASDPACDDCLLQCLSGADLDPLCLLNCFGGGTGSEICDDEVDNDDDEAVDCADTDCLFSPLCMG